MNLLVSLLLMLPAAEEAPSHPEGKVPSLVPRLASADAGEVDRAFGELERLCFHAGRPGAEPERKAVAQAVGDALVGSGQLAAGARVLLLRSLETIGRGEVIPVLAKLIAPGTDPAVREGARRALEANPHVNAKRELRSALRQADGELRLGIIRSIGVRRDFLATADLIDLAAEKDVETRLAGLEALASIGDVSAVPVHEEALKALAGADLAVARRAYLRLADSLVRNGERGAARRIYDRAAGLGPELRSAALLGFARAGLQSEIGRIAEALADSNAAVRGAAAEAAAILPGPEMTKVLLGKLGSSEDPAARAVLLEVLARRGGAEAREAVLQEAAGGRSPASRAAAIRLLRGPLIEKDPQPVLDVLLGALDAGGEVAGAAEVALAAAPGAAEVLSRPLTDPTGAKRAALIRAAAARGSLGPVEAGLVRSAAKDSSPAVRVAALNALGKAGDAAAIPILLEALRAEEKVERDAAIAALSRLPVAEIDQAVANALAAEKGQVRSGLLRVLGARRAPDALRRLTESASDSDPQVRLAAVEGLGRLGDAAALPVLLKAIDDPDPELGRAAVRGCLRFAEALAREKRDEAMKVYAKALDVARSDEDLAVALRGLSEGGGEETLEKIERFLKPGSLQREAGRAALRVAERLPAEKQDRAREIYRRILTLEVDEATASQCVRRLRRLGVEIDPAREAGFVTRWWILAPLPNPQGALWEKELPPERGVDLEKEVAHGSQSYKWKRHHTPSPRGLVDLVDAGYPQSEVGAYLYAEVAAKEARDAVFKLGSDDQVVCWLNGEKVHANRSSRGLEPDQDRFDVKLREGTNRILLKVLNDGGGWGACLRIAGKDGKPVTFQERDG